MKIIDVEQGSQEWLDIRLGLISASRFKDLLSEPRAKKDQEAGKLSATAQSYINELIAEILTGVQKTFYENDAIRHGKENEPRARSEYEFETGFAVVEKGICIHDNNLFGASPDGFVDDDGMIEIKCPYNSGIHIDTVLNGMPVEHMAQVQGNLWINGRQWCDFISFDPRIDGTGRIYIERIERDEDYIMTLEKKLFNASQKMQQILNAKFGINWKGVSV